MGCSRMAVTVTNWYITTGRSLKTMTAAQLPFQNLWNFKEIEKLAQPEPVFNHNIHVLDLKRPENCGEQLIIRKGNFISANPFYADAMHQATNFTSPCRLTFTYMKFLRKFQPPWGVHNTKSWQHLRKQCKCWQTHTTQMQHDMDANDIREDHHKEAVYIFMHVPPGNHRHK